MWIEWSEPDRSNQLVNSGEGDVLPVFVLVELWKTKVNKMDYVGFIAKTNSEVVWLDVLMNDPVHV